MGEDITRPVPPVIKVLRVRENAKLPERKTTEAAGMDVYSAMSAVIPPGMVITIPTGIAFDIPKGWFILVNPRTGLAVKHGIGVLAGVIDSDYRGEIDVILFNISVHSYAINVGDRIAQFVVLPCAFIGQYGNQFSLSAEHWRLEEVTALSETERGAGRFGHTGG